MNAGAQEGVIAQTMNYMDMSIAGGAFETASPSDEFLHPPAASGHYSATETSYFGFSIPEKFLNAEIYMWFHPVLQVMSASVYIWKGLKESSLACEYVNHYHYLPFPKSDIGEYEIADVGLKIKVIEPLKSVQIDYADADRGVSFSLLSVGIMPPCVRPGGHHFTQAVKTSGELNLFGERLAIDGYFSRDRSWSEERREVSKRLPPVSWIVGVIDETFAFHVTAFDSAEDKPEWLDRYPIGPGQNMRWGYVFRDKQLFPLTSARKLTIREPDGLSPRLIELSMTDTGGQTHAFRGYVQARMPWQTWQNMNVFFCQMRWEGARGVGYGDVQDIQLNDFVHHFAR